MRARASIAITLGVTVTAILVNSNVLAQQTPALATPYEVTPLLKGPVTGDPNKGGRYDQSRMATINA
jgi:hypothetical protein